MTQHDTDKLLGCHPELIKAVGIVLDSMGALGHVMMVTDGLRTTAEQQALYAKGRTQPGHVVTNADGITNRSNHQVHVDGFGHAADLCFLVNGAASWNPTLPWGTYGSCTRAAGLKWGGDWESHLVDLPHIELP